MARAVSIWLVTEDISSDAYHTDFIPAAAFTVKHELVTWLERKSPEARRCLKLTKMPDGYREDPALEDLPIIEFLDTERRARERAEEREAIWRRSLAFNRRY